MKQKKNKKPQKKLSERSLKVRAFFKRYWYWFVVIPVLAGAVVGWCFGMGFFGKKKEIIYLAQDIEMFPGTYYYFDVEDGATIEITQSSEVLLTKEGKKVIFANSIGNAKAVVKSGYTVITAFVHVEEAQENWILKTGTKIPVTEMQKMATDVFRGAFGYKDSDTSVFGEDGEGVSEYFVAKKEGFALFEISIDGINICDISILVQDDPEKEVYDTRLRFVSDEMEKEFDNNKSNMEFRKKNIELGMGELVSMDDITGLEFGGNGNVYFRSSDQSVVRTYQNGQIYAELPGTAVITAACIGDSGMDYFNVKVEIDVGEREIKFEDENNYERDVIVNEEINKDVLTGKFFHENLAGFEIEDKSYFEIINEEFDKFRIVAKSATGSKGTYINGYANTDNGKVVIVRYKIVIKNENEEGENDE